MLGLFLLLYLHFNYLTKNKLLCQGFQRFQQQKVVKNQEKVVKRNRTYILLLIIILITQVVSETAHLPFDGELRESICFICIRLLNIGFIPALFLRLMARSKAEKYTFCILSVYNLTFLLMELIVLLDPSLKSVVININQYSLSGLVLIAASTLLMIPIEYFANDLLISYSDKYSSFSLPLQGADKEGDDCSKNRK